MIRGNLTNSRMLALWTCILCVITVIGLVWAAAPTIPSGGVAVPGDTAVVATSNQIAEGLWVTLPNVTQKSASVVIVPFGPFSAESPTKSEIGAGDVSTFRLTYQPGHGTDAGEQLAAVAVVGDTGRKITAKVADPPFWPVVAVLVGIGTAWAIGWAQSQFRLSQEAQEYALTVLANIQEQEPNSGDVDGDGQPEFTISDLASKRIGAVAPRDTASVFMAILDGNQRAATERLAAVELLYHTFEEFGDRARALLVTHEDWRPKLTAPLPQVFILTETLLRGTSGATAFTDETHLNDVDGRVRQMTSLYDVYRRVHERHELARIICANLQQTSRSWPSDADRNTLTSSTYMLSAAWSDLQTVTHVADVTAWKIEDRLESILTSLRTLQALHLPAAFKAASSIPAAAATVVMPTPHANLAAAPTATVAQHVKTEAARIHARIRLLNWSLTMLAIVIGTVTATVTLYVGKPFGTPFDYAMAVFWGFGVDQSLKGLAALLGKLGLTSPLAAK